MDTIVSDFVKHFTLVLLEIEQTKLAHLRIQSAMHLCTTLHSERECVYVCAAVCRLYFQPHYVPCQLSHRFPFQAFSTATQKSVTGGGRREAYASKTRSWCRRRNGQA